MDSADAAVRSEIGDGTLTIQQNGVNVGTFKANQNTGELINITVPAAPGTLNTNNDTAIAVNSSEALSGTVKLHKVAKTGSYEDLLDKPTVPAAANNGTLTIQYGNNTLGTFTANQPDNQNVSVNIPAYNDGCSDTTFCELLRIVRSLQDEINQLHGEVDDLKDQVSQLEAANCPILGSVTVSDVTFGSATLSATIGNYDPLTVQEFGFLVSTSEIGDYDASIKYPVTTQTAGLFTMNMTGLQPGTTYYVRAYVLNDAVRCTQATMMGEPNQWETDPFVVTLSNTSLCMGEGVTVSATNTSISNIGTVQYSWSTGQNEASFTDTPDAIGEKTYTVSVTYGGITVTASATITVNVMPDATITANPTSAYSDGTTQVFIGTTELTLSVEEQTNAEYAWSTGANTHSIEVSPTEDTKYVVTVTIGDCVAKDSVTARIDVCPSLSKVSVAPTPSAEGSVDLSATMSMFTGEINDLGFIMTTDPTWTSNVDTLHISPITTPVTELSLTKPGLVYNIPYYFKAYMKPNSIECTAEIIVGDTAKFMFQDENFKITINKDSVCAGDTVTLVAPEGGTEYVWSTGETTPIIKVVQNEAATKIYTVTVSIGNVSKAVGVKVTTTLKHMVLYADSIASNTLKFYLLDNVTGADYVWKKNGEIITGAATNSYSVDYANLNENDIYGVSVSFGNCTVKDSVRVSWVTTAVRQCGGATVEDYEGNVYNTLAIGSYCWTRENMRATKYFDGQSYVDILDGTSLPTSAEIAYRYNPYDRDILEYGYLYNWTAATGNAANILAPENIYTYIQGVCPEGWHLPSYYEKFKLVYPTGAEHNSGKLAGAGWTQCCEGTSAPGNYEYSERNITGFSAVQCGRWDNQDNGEYGYYFPGAFFWTSFHDGTAGYYFYLLNADSEVHEQDYDRQCGAAVRCVRDPQPVLSLSSEPDGGTVSLCGGNSVAVSYTANITNGNSEDYTYSWSVYQSGSNDAVKTGTVNPYTVTYTSAGDYTVSCTATKGTKTLNASISTTITAEGTIPSYNYCVNELTLSVWSTTGNPTSIQWGDGQIDESVEDYITYHSYSTPGTYQTVISEAHGCSTTVSVQVGAKTHTSCAISTLETANTSLIPNVERGHDGLIDSVRDHEGNWYEVVQIGSQCWLKENMRCITSPSTGSYIVYNPSSENDHTAIQSYTSKIAHWYNNDSITYAPMGYGLLYNWCAAMDTFKTGTLEVATQSSTSGSWKCTLTGHRRGICPKGWHVPSNEEWTQMENELNPNVPPLTGENGFRGSHAGKLSTGCAWTINSRLQSANYSIWSQSPGDYDYNGRNSSGFSALPSGYYSSGSFNRAGPVTAAAQGLGLFTDAIFWSDQYKDSEISAWTRSLRCNSDGVFITNYPKSNGYSVRCVRDVESIGSGGTQTGRLIPLNDIQQNFVAQDGDTLTDELESNYQISIADGATVTLRDATINGTNDELYGWAGITCLGDATIILEGTNTVEGFYEDYPGIHIATGKLLVIQGQGSLSASSKGWAAGIGGGINLSCGSILINSGTITATGGYYAAGIGSGLNASCGDVTISDGTVTAEGGAYAAGIGSGFANNANSECGNIIIGGGTVTATGGQWAAGIGSGLAAHPSTPRYSRCGDISISGGTVVASGGGGANMSTLLTGKDVYCPGGAGIGTGSATIYQGTRLGYSSCGSITIENTVTSVTATKGDTGQSYCSIGRNCGSTIFNGGTCGTVTIGGTVYWDGTGNQTYPDAPYQNDGDNTTTGLPHSPYEYQP